MKRLFLVSILSFVYISQLFSVWDLQIASSVSADIRMETVSIPFEGMNRPDSFVRTFDIFYGTVYRNIYNSTVIDSQIVFFQWFNVYNTANLASCFYESNQYDYRRWGFAKYLITFRPTSDTGKTIRFYFNSLDSKCGTDSITGYGYHADLAINYYYNGGNPYVVVGSNVPVISDTVRFNEQYKEISMWKLFYNRTTPLEKDFKVKTTPFPLSPKASGEWVRDIIVGTKVVLDTVLPYLGNSDRYGYNTWTGTAEFPRNYYTNPPVPAGENDQGNTFCTPAQISYFLDDPVFGMKLSAQSGDTMIIKRSKVLWISGLNEPQNYGDTMLFKSGSTLILEPSAELEACFGGVIIYETGSGVTWDEHTCSSAENGSQIVITGGGTFVVNNGGFIQIKNGGKLVLGDNTTLSFESDISPLILRTGSQVIMGNNSKIQFKNGAFIWAVGSTFSCPNSSWQGITFENSGKDTIHNCVFNNASTYLNWSQSGSTAGLIKKITGNIFNSGGIKFSNVGNCLIQNNTFNSSGYSGNLIEIENDTILNLTHSLNIVTNFFKGGTIQLKLDCFNSQQTPFYIYGNHFYGLSGTSRIGLWGYKISGDFKLNTFEDNHYSSAVHLKNSNLNFLSNSLRSASNDNLEFTISSVGQLAPLEPSAGAPGTLYWYGGRNSMHQDNQSSVSTVSNCFFDEGSILNIDKGKNCFNIYNVSSNYHIIGNFTCAFTVPVLPGTQNYWNITPPRYTFNCSGSLNYGNPYSSECAASLPGGSPGNEVSDMGSGIYDTLFVTIEEGGDGGGGEGGSVGSTGEDISLYFNLMSNKRTKNYTSGIEKAKGIIDGFDSSKFLLPSLDALYLCYHLSDTLQSQSNTNTLFAALKGYLEEKIVQYGTNAGFTEKAYNYYLMSLVKLRQFTQAIAGYENIMENHPNPVTRLAASWDRSSVVLLMNGQGGSLSSAKDKDRKLHYKRPDKIARKIFKTMSKSVEVNDGSGKRQSTKEELTQVQYTKEEKNVISQRVTKFNPSTRMEFKEKVSGDISILLSFGKNSGKDNISIPTRFNVQQNYPNPFNPQTTIKYDIPKDNFVMIKVYDILGRQVFNVNEFKKAGNYEVKFDGSDLASGIYFYSIESGNFKDTKKMVLLK